MTPFEQFYNSLGAEGLQELNRKQLEYSERQYQEFSSEFKKGMCCYCQGTLNTINEKNGSCYHWLLAPKGLKKKYIELFFKEHQDYLALLTYLKWVANTEVAFSAINNLVEEKNPAKLVEETIKYKEVEWAISCGRTDFEGHKGSENADFPHYHFSMIVGGRPLISFNDLHLPFSKRDTDIFKTKDEHPDKVDIMSHFTQGMEEIINRVPPEDLLNAMTNSDDYDNSTFRMQTMVLPKPGQTISGDDLINIMNRSKEEDIPIAKLLQDSESYETKVFISPGDGIPEMRTRNPRKKKK